MSNRVIQLIVLFVGVAVVAAGLCILVSMSQHRSDRPCSDYENYAVSDIPARCASYFGITGE